MKRRNIINEYLSQLDINPNDPIPIDAIKINAFINCCGIGIDHKLDNTLAYMDEWRTGHIGLSMNFGIEVGLDLRTVAFLEWIGSIEEIPVGLTYDGEEWILTIYGKRLMKVNIIPPPSWYNEEVKPGIRKNTVFQYELGNLMGTVPMINKRQDCIYFYSKMKPCKFCSLEQKEKNILPEDYARVASDAYQEKNTTVTLTGGNTGDINRGVELYIEYVQAIRDKLPHIPIEIEASPPTDLDLFDQLKEAGLTSYNSNFEVFDENKRKEICPSKAQMIPREDYWRAYEYSRKLGLCTYGALIVGLDSDQSLLKGVEYLAQLGVMTNPLPFKPLKGAVFANKPPLSPLRFMNVSWHAVKIMRKFHVEPHKQRTGGCGLCGGCSMEVNIDRNYSRIESYMKNYSISDGGG